MNSVPYNCVDVCTNTKTLSNAHKRAIKNPRFIVDHVEIVLRVYLYSMLEAGKISHFFDIYIDAKRLLLEQCIIAPLSLLLNWIMYIHVMLGGTVIFSA